MTGPTDSTGPSIQARKDAWQRTLVEMETVRDELQADGWAVFAIPIGHTAPMPPDRGDDDRFGLVTVIPGNYVESFVTAFNSGEFEQYDVLRQQVSGHVFSLVQLFDPPSKTAILLALQFQSADAEPLLETVREDGMVYTHVQTLNGEHLGSFRLEDPSKVFPSLSESES